MKGQGREKEGSVAAHVCLIGTGNARKRTKELYQIGMGCFWNPTQLLGGGGWLGRKKVGSGREAQKLERVNDCHFLLGDKQRWHLHIISLSLSLLFFDLTQPDNFSKKNYKMTLAASVPCCSVPFLTPLQQFYSFSSTMRDRLSLQAWNTHTKNEKG